MAGYDRTLETSLRTARRALGARARALRLVHRLTQEALAERADVGVQTIRRFELGTAAPTIDLVFRIAFALHAEASLDKLFELPAFASIDDALARPAILARKRAPRRT